MRFLALVVSAFALAGCVSVDTDAVGAIDAMKRGDFAAAEEWSVDLADSHYSKNLGMVEAGRVSMLSGDFDKADGWFRRGVDTAVDRKEQNPKIKLGDVGNTVLASTITDDRTREYYLPPYELNFALQYGILSQLFAGKRDDAMADARLAVYVQDHLADEYGPDVAKASMSSDRGAQQLYDDQGGNLQTLIAETRCSWENPVLWWLTGVLFETDGDLDMAWQSYRKAAAILPRNAVFSNDCERADHWVAPRSGKARLVAIRDRDFVPMRKSVKVPVPIYTAMSIDIPTYDASLCARTPDTALDVLALGARDLKEHLPGIIARNITRAATQAAAQAVANNNGNEYVQLGVLLGNAVISAMRRADTRSWRTLPATVEVWEDNDMSPGDYQVFGETVSLAAGETKLLWVAEFGGPRISRVIKLK